MDSFVDRIVQYAAKEQAELRVRIRIPGSWFNNLKGAEARELYAAEANGSEEAFRFPKKVARAAQTCAGVRFICESDVIEDPHEGDLYHSDDEMEGEEEDEEPPQ